MPNGTPVGGLYKGNRKNNEHINREKSTAAARAKSRATGPVGFGSGATRTFTSCDANNKNGSSVSSKFIRKVFGKALLGQIK